MAFPELVTNRFVNTNASGGPGKAPNSPWTPPALTTTDPAIRQGYLNSNEIGEVYSITVWPPVSSSGSPDSTTGLDIQLVLDDQPYDWIHLTADLLHNMAPHQDDIRHGVEIIFGRPTFGRDGSIAGLLEPCPKFLQKVSVRVTPQIGSAAFAEDYTVDVKTFVYLRSVLASVMPVYSQPNLIIVDTQNSRQFTVPGRTVEAGNDWSHTWKELPGGPRQTATNAIWPLVRWAWNNNPTTPSQAYQFMYSNSASNPGVPNSYNNLYFQLESAQAIVMQRLGVVGPVPNSSGQDLLSAAIYTGSEAEKRHPYGGIPVNYLQNKARFGLIPGESKKFYGLPRLPQGEQLLTNEVAYVGAVDNGVQVNGEGIPAGQIWVGIQGVYIETGAGGQI